MIPMAGSRLPEVACMETVSLIPDLEVFEQVSMCLTGLHTFLDALEAALVPPVRQRYAPGRARH